MPRPPFLPPGCSEGWVAYAWLIYLGFYILYPVLARASAAEWAVYGLGLVVFLVFYFRAFWVSGRRILPYVVAMTLLGVVYTPFNAGASCFFIYAAAFLDTITPPRRALAGITLILVVAGAQAWLVSLPPWAWLPPLLFAPLVGGVNVHYAEIRRKDARIRMAQDEIERLATVAERERIARDLHDLLGHTLSVITLKSELASKLATRDPERATQEIRDVERISRDALAQVRSAVHGYRETGLQEEVARAREALGAAGVRLDVEVEPTRRAGFADHALAFALREAVTNVIRHARATECRIRLVEDGSTTLLEITDDGVGGTAPEGSGLSGMRARLATLAGRVERDGRRGTRLLITVPRRAEA